MKTKRASANAGPVCAAGAAMLRRAPGLRSSWLLLIGALIAGTLLLPLLVGCSEGGERAAGIEGTAPSVGESGASTSSAPATSATTTASGSATDSAPTTGSASSTPAPGAATTSSTGEQSTIDAPQIQTAADVVSRYYRAIRSSDHAAYLETLGAEPGPAADALFDEEKEAFAARGTAAYTPRELRVVWKQAGQWVEEPSAPVDEATEAWIDDAPHSRVLVESFTEDGYASVFQVELQAGKAFIRLF